MTTKKKPASDAIREKGYGDAFICRDSTAIRSRLKTVIVDLALLELIPAGLATWLIQCGGLLHD